MGTTASSTGDPICDQQHQQRVQVYYPSVYYTSGGEQMIRSTGGFLQESDLSSAVPSTAEYGFSCVEPSTNACIITARKPSSGCAGAGGTRQHVYDIPHRFKKEPTAVCLMSRSSTVCPVADVSLSCPYFLFTRKSSYSSLCATNDQMKVAEVRAVKTMPGRRLLCLIVCSLRQRERERAEWKRVLILFDDIFFPPPIPLSDAHFRSKRTTVLSTPVD